ncbi:MAG TPA: arginine--tRNA ligase [Acidimicrobiaceae bacterium]|nr:arginine--tRNA ligase [Acidimicrobiaceae bacterium]
MAVSHADGSPQGAPVIRQHLSDALTSELLALGIAVPAVVHLEQPARREHGDWSSNIAMASAKAAGRPPRELATALVDALNARLPEYVERVELAGPGFVNFHLNPGWLHQVLIDTVNAGESQFGRSTVGAGTNVMVEFVSANPTGPLHAGHARGATYGDAVARVLEWAGYSVAREFYINDRGAQMLKLGESILARIRGEEPPEGGYFGEYITEWASSLDPEIAVSGDVEAATEHGYRCALDDQRAVLAELGVVFDVWFSERSLMDTGAIEQTLADLRERSMIEDRDGAIWLLSTQYGDDKDRVLVKSDGSFTYLLPDIAYHRDKFARGFDLLINVWGADHHGYVKRMHAAISALGHRAEQLDIRITQLVKLLKNGEEVKISKRAGNIIELRDIIDEVGADSTRLVYLLQSIDSPQTVDLGVIAEQSMDNPVFYVQMAHARLCSVAAKASAQGIERIDLAQAVLEPLVHPRELEVLRVLNNFSEVVELAARERAPHKVSSWVRELASEVHGFYHDCPILRDDVPADLQQARLWLGEAARVGLRCGLNLLGASAPESM